MQEFLRGQKANVCRWENQDGKTKRTISSHHGSSSIDLRGKGTTSVKEGDRFHPRRRMKTVHRAISSFEGPYGLNGRGGPPPFSIGKEGLE